MKSAELMRKMLFLKPWVTLSKPGCVPWLMIQDWKWMHSAEARACTQLVSVVKAFPITIGSKNSWWNYLNRQALDEVLVSYVVWRSPAGNERPSMESLDC